MTTQSKAPYLDKLEETNCTRNSKILTISNYSTEIKHSIVQKKNIYIRAFSKKAYPNRKSNLLKSVKTRTNAFWVSKIYVFTFIIFYLHKSYNNFPLNKVFLCMNSKKIQLKNSYSASGRFLRIAINTYFALFICYLQYLFVIFPPSKSLW